MFLYLCLYYVFVIKMNIQIRDKDMTILEKMHYMLLKETRKIATTEGNWEAYIIGGH